MELPFTPGLIGGHCIGVDPYYLTFKASEIGYSPKMILAGRKINDTMSEFVVGKLLRLMRTKGIAPNVCKILILGLTFKENCPDTRNSKVFDVVEDLRALGCDVNCYDPWVNVGGDALLDSLLIKEPEIGAFDVIVLAVGHQQFIKMGANRIRSFGKKKHLFFDLKYVFGSDETDGRL